MIGPVENTYVSLFWFDVITSISAMDEWVAVASLNVSLELVVSGASVDRARYKDDVVGIEFLVSVDIDGNVEKSIESEIVEDSLVGCTTTMVDDCVVTPSFVVESVAGTVSVDVLLLVRAALGKSVD